VSPQMSLAMPVTDYRSRYLFACEGLESVKKVGVFPVFERVFRE
jgi:putative transposase